MLARALLLPATLAAAAGEASFSPACDLAGNWTDGTCVGQPVSARCAAQAAAALLLLKLQHATLTDTHCVCCAAQAAQYGPHRVLAERRRQLRCPHHALE